MTKITYFFALLFAISLVACTADAPQDDKSAEVKVSTTPAKTIEEMKKNDVKAYNRTKYDNIIKGFQHPESVITDGEFFYVSNVGAKMAPSVKDADGFITKMTAEGKIMNLKWVDGKKEQDLHAPKGMAIVKGVLYVADIDKIRGYNMKSKKKIFELDFAETGTVFLNDLTVKDEHTLFVSSTDLGRVYKVSLKGNGSYEMMEIWSDLSGANGLHYDKAKDRLLIASFGLDGAPIGMVGVCDLKAEKLKQKTIGTFKGFLDGIQQVADDMVLVSDWQDFEKGGNLKFYDLVTEEVTAVMSGLIGGPADFYYDEKTKNIWMPAMQDNELIITKVNVDLNRKNQGTVINSSGGYHVTTRDSFNFQPEKVEE